MRRAQRALPGATALAVALVGVELLVRLLVWGSYPGATALLVLACGAALVPFLPNELDRPTLRAAAAATLGMASFAVVLTTISIAGIGLTDVSIHLAVAAFVAVLAVAARAIAEPGADSRRVLSRREAYAAALLLGVVGFGLASAWDSVGPFPPPAVDWGHYLLYADEVENQGALLIDDPYAGEEGRLFANSPGVGALYGAVRIVDGVPSEWLAYGIVVVSALTALSMFALAGALWGLRAGLAASAFWVVAPIHMDTIRWHGVGTNLALLFVPLAVLGLALLYRGARGWRVAGFLGGSLIGVAAMHSTSAFLVGCLVLVAIVIDIVRQALRHRLVVRLWWQDGIFRTLLAAPVFAAVAGLGVLVHVRAQAADLGRPIDASLLEPDWLSWEVLVDFYAPGFLVLTAASALVVLATTRLRRDPALLAVLGLLMTCAAVSELWRLEISFEYRRVVFYAGISLAVLIGVALSRLVRGPVSAVAAVAVLVYVVHGSIGLRLPERLLTDFEPKGKEAETIRRFGEALRRGEVRDASMVITDRCHTFVVPYLLRRPTIIAFEPWQVGFESRVPLAAKGVAILEGGERGRRLARSLDVGYVVANPVCTPGLAARLGGSVVVATGDVVVIDVRERRSSALKSHFELSPAEYERRRQGHLHRRRVELVAGEVAQLPSGAAVLELGCGSGDVLAAVGRGRPDVSFLGVDLDEGMVAYANATHARDNVAYELRDVVVTPPALSASLVYGIDVLHHVHELEPLARAVAGLLGPRARWLAIEPNSRNPYIWLHQERMRRAGLDEDHFRRRSFESACRAAGLDVAERRTAFVVPGAVRRVPRVVARLERLLERVPVLGGSGVYVVARA